MNLSNKKVFEQTNLEYEMVLKNKAYNRTSLEFNQNNTK